MSNRNAQIVERLSSGATVRAIAAEFGISHGRVVQIAKWHEQRSQLAAMGLSSLRAWGPLVNANVVGSDDFGAVTPQEIARRLRALPDWRETFKRAKNVGAVTFAEYEALVSKH
jgi:hypothetical protein